MSATKIKVKETAEIQEPFKFDNMFGELEFYKKRCDVLEKDIIKSQNTIKKMDVSLKKLQEINTINAKNLNNTSIPFFLTSEFKNNWENFAKDQIMEAFENTFDNYFWLANVVQDTLSIIYNETNNVIIEKINSILKTLNIEEKHPEKFVTRFRTFFQEIKSKLNEVMLKYKNFDEKLSRGLKSDIDSKSFKSLSHMIFKLCIYMLLHEPQLSLSIQPYEKRELSYNYYSKTDHLNIEGFGNDLSACITILSPPMLRNYFPFQGIKPSVYIIPNPDDEIIKSCEKNKVTKKIGAQENTSSHNEKASSPIKTDRKPNEVSKDNEIISANNLVPSPKINSEVKVTNVKVNKNNNQTHPKDQSNSSSIKDKIPTSYMKFNKNFGKDIIISENIIYNVANEEPSSLNQCYNHPLSLNKKKMIDKDELEENTGKNNFRLVSQNNKTSSKNSSKSCSLNTSLKNDPLKLSEFSDPNDNHVKTTQRQNSSRTALNTIDQPLYRDSLNANKNPTHNPPNASNISFTRKKNFSAMKQNSLDNKSEININDHFGFNEDNKLNYPLKSHNQLYDKQNTFSELPGRIMPTDKNFFLTTNQQFLRKKSKSLLNRGSITPDPDSKPKEDSNIMKKSVETNSACNLIKKIKNPLEGTDDKKKSEILSNSNSNKLLNSDNNKVFSSTQKKAFGLALKMNKFNKESLNEGPFTNRYDYPLENQDRFLNNNEAKFNGPKNSNYESNEVSERNKAFSSNKPPNQTTTFKKITYENTEKFIRNEINQNNFNTNKLESYTKKFGQILNKNDKKY